MLTRVDRIQIGSSQPEVVAASWTRLLDAQEINRDSIDALGADRITLNVGNCQVEVLSPKQSGVLHSHLETHPNGLFAAGFSTTDLAGLKRQLTEHKVEFLEEANQLYLLTDDLGIEGLQLVISEDEHRDTQGLMQNLYEVTHLTSAVDAVADRFAALFALDRQQFVAIKSADYGYAGYLTLVNPLELDRIETINPFDHDKTMGRFFRKFGASLYMCYGECDDLDGLRKRLMTHVPNDWTGDRQEPLDGLFIHPNALGGVMLGVSRPTFAWSWSGSPDRIIPR